MRKKQNSFYKKISKRIIKSLEMQLKLIVLIQLKYILRKPELEENKRKPFAEELDKYG